MNAKSNFILPGAASLIAALLLAGCCTSHKVKCSGCCQDKEAKATAVATPPAAVPVKLALKLVKVDSQETEAEDGKGANAVDGSPDTFWHTQWQDANPPCPHEIIIELVPPATIKGFTYLPRQDGGVNGTIKDFEFYAADSDADFGQPVARGAFGEGTELKTVAFASKKCRFIKLKALSEINGEAWTSAAEIGVVTE